MKRIALVGHKSVEDFVPVGDMNVPRRVIEQDKDWGRIVRNDIAVYLHMKMLAPPGVIVEFVDASRIASVAQRYDFIIIDYIGLPFLYSQKPNSPFIKMLSKYRQKLYPNIKVMKVLNNKCNMYKFFRDNGVRISPEACTKMEPGRRLSTNVNRLKNALKGENDVFLKPAEGFMDKGIKHIVRPAPEKLEAYAKEAVKEKYGQIVVQKFVPSFASNLEMRNYYICGKFQFAIFTNPSKTTVIRVKNRKEAEKHKLGLQFARGRRIANQTMAAVKEKLYAKKYSPGLLRLDVGCCLNQKNTTVFMNEIEFLPGLFLLNFADVKYAHEILNNIAKCYLFNAQVRT